MPGVPFLTAQLGANARVIVEAAWGADLSAAPSTWTWFDITADVRMAGGQKVRITPGRGDESSQASPASCGFQLDNTAGTYSPYTPASIRYPNVRRSTPIRVSVDPGNGSGTFTRFLGYANGFVPSWDKSAKLAIVTVSASGILRRLGQGKSPLRSTMYRSIVAAQPAAYWPLEDGSTTTSTSTQATSAVPGGIPMTWTGTTPTRSSKTLRGSAPLMTLGNDTAMVGSVQAYTSPTNWWGLQFIVNMAARPTVDTVILRVWNNGTLPRWELVYGPGGGGLMFWNVYNSSGVAVDTFVANTSFDVLFPGGNPAGREVLIGWNIHQSGTGIAVDGAWSWQDNAGIDWQSGFNSDTVASATNGIVTRVEVPNTGNKGGWTLGHLSVIGRRFWLFFSPWIGWEEEPPTKRMYRLCAEERIPLAITGLPNFDGFETSAFTNTVTGTWARDNAMFWSGTWSLKSATITDSQQSDHVVTVPAGARTMWVRYKVSSESGFDFFRILRDGVQEFQTSGEVDWTLRLVDVTGVSQVTFRYIKDSSALSGSDAAWIDDLAFYRANVDQVADPVSTAVASMDPQPLDTLINLLRECETVDAGVLFDGFSAGLGFVTNAARYDQAAALTLDVSAGHVSDPFAPVDDDQRNRNKVTVSRKGGASATAEDSTGPLGTAAIGTYDTSLTLATSNDLALPDRASWEVHKGTVEGLRYPSLTLDLAANPGLVAAWLNTSLQERIDVVNITSRATQHPPGDVSLLLEGYTENLSPFEWTVSCNCSPYSPYRVLKLDDPGFGRLDTAGSKLVAAASAGATSLSVAANPGPLWITTATFPAQFPIDINVGGWEVTATGITSALNSNPFFEVNAAGWTVVDGTIARSTAQFHQGAASLLLTPSGTGPAPRTESDRVPVSAGVSYQSSAWVRCAVARTVEVDIAWYTAANTFLSSSVTSLSVAANTWTQITTTATPPATATQAACLVGMTGTPPSSHLLWIDEAMMADPARQTFTVNPIPAAIAINAAVKLWRPNAIAL